MTADRLAEIEARIEAATPGPWEARSDYVETAEPFDLHRFDSMGLTVARCAQDIADAAFIAHARTDLPATTKALRAVLALHEDRPANLPSLVERGMRFCRHCDNIFPCPTVRAITDALDGAS